MRKENIIRTPKLKIPIGVAVKNANGTYSLKIKKSKTDQVEEVPIDSLFSMVISGAEETTKVADPKQ